MIVYLNPPLFGYGHRRQQTRRRAPVVREGDLLVLKADPETYSRL